jgi:hypothetical protein
MKRTLVLAVLLAVPVGAKAQVVVGDAPLSEYLQRADSVTLGAGDAKERNAAIHMIDPSPAQARNRAIPGHGERMSNAIRRYQDVTKLKDAARPISAESGVGTGGSASSGK